MKTFASYFYLLFLSMIFSCEDPYKDPNKLELPPITMEGKNTFGCKVNGEIWVAYVEDPGLFNEKLSVRYEAGGINISGYLNSPKLGKQERIYVPCNTDKLGLYTIPDPPYDGGVFADLLNPKITTCSRYKCWYEDTKIEITKLDTDNRIISGLFEYKNATICGDTVNITDGRFDVKY